jgi:hypothetical protein
MKKLFILSIIMFSMSMIHFTSSAQERFGKTLNLGLGVGGYSGYYKYAGRSLPVFHLDYEFDVAKDFTLAPFISFYRYSNEYYWGNNNYPDQWYTYSETVIPVGLKGTYYFDNLLKATNKWDFYLGASLGFALVNASWEAGYNGDKKYFNNKGNSVFLDLHIGAEYHFNERLGAFLDLSSGVSTIGLAIHGR